jgi:predicted nucleotidyltransferase component of viral defense system
MMEKWIKSLLPDPLPDTSAGMVNALREIIQSMALLGLWRAKFFEHAAFYGGTALRLLYGLDRYSEDCDFSLLTPDSEFSFEPYGSALLNELQSFGLDASFQMKEKSTNTAIESAFLKANTLHTMMIIEVPERLMGGVHPQALLKVKLEIDTNPPSDYDTEMKYVFSPVQFAVRSYNLPSLFAGKIHAVLFRKWKNRVKGRDWYDFAWYASRYPVLNIAHLEARMRHSGDFSLHKHLTKSMLMEYLIDAIDALDISQAKEEVTPFVNNSTLLSLWSKDYFIAAAQRITTQG